MLEQGEQKRTMSSLLIVSDKYLELKQQSKVQGLIRVVLYLQDLGLVPKGPKGKSEAVSLDTA